MLDSCHDFTTNLQAAAVTSCSYAFTAQMAIFKEHIKLVEKNPVSPANEFSTALSTIPRWPLKELKYN